MVPEVLDIADFTVGHEIVGKEGTVFLRATVDEKQGM
jgi:hypothetical protein